MGQIVWCNAVALSDAPRAFLAELVYNQAQKDLDLVILGLHSTEGSPPLSRTKRAWGQGLKDYVRWELREPQRSCKEQS